MTVEIKTRGDLSFFFIIEIRPVTKAETPATIPVSIVRAKTGLVEISFRIVPPAGTESYNVFVSDAPIKNNIGIATIR